MTAPSPHCALCERPIALRPGAEADAWLCSDCSSYPVLVAAFTEGRARRAATASEAAG